MLIMSNKKDIECFYFISMSIWSNEMFLSYLNVHGSPVRKLKEIRLFNLVNSRKLLAVFDKH